MGIEARDYLADDFDMQAEGNPSEYAQSYHAFADYLRTLPADDGCVVALSELLHPFLTDDPRLGGTLYPDGDAVRFMDSFVPDGDPEDCKQYLGEFLRHLRADYERWLAHVAAHGADVAWTLETGRPEVNVCLLHFETAPTSVPPLYESWEHYLASTTPAERRAMCASRVKKANARRLMSAAPERRLTADDVWRIAEAARGRCVHCGSLCLEKLPYDPVTKKKLPWAHVGRRIGSLHHLIPRVRGGTNDPANLAWSCLWCNTWNCERIAGATDHGGSQLTVPSVSLSSARARGGWPGRPAWRLWPARGSSVPEHRMPLLCDLGQLLAELITATATGLDLVAVRAECDHVPGIIGTVITKPQNVIDMENRLTSVGHVIRLPGAMRVPA